MGILSLNSTLQFHFSRRMNNSVIIFLVLSLSIIVQPQAELQRNKEISTKDGEGSQSRVQMFTCNRGVQNTTCSNSECLIICSDGSERTVNCEGSLKPSLSVSSAEYGITIIKATCGKTNGNEICIGC